VRFMNQRNPEKDCLTFENMVQSIRLIVLDGFPDAPRPTEQLQRLAQSAPLLFMSMLPREELDIPEDETDVKLEVAADDAHPEPSVLVRVKAGAYKAIGFPIREGEMNPAFSSLLHKAYAMDFDKNIIITSNGTLKWWKKLSFDVRYMT